MKPRNLLVAAVLLAALSGVVWWAKRHPQSSGSAANTPPAPKLADISDAAVQQIELKKKDGSTIVLDRKSGKWVITAPEFLRADQDAVATIVSSLNPVTADSIVEDKPSDLKKIGSSHSESCKPLVIHAYGQLCSSGSGY